MSHLGLQAGDRILFQGDSITDAFRRPAEVNEAYQLGNGYAFLVAAHLRLTRPADRLAFFNRGISGNRIANLAERWEADALALRPTVVSLLVGINDTLADVASGGQGAALAEYERQYRALLARTPARFILCEPFALMTGMITPAHRENLAPRQRLVRQLAAEHGTALVELQEAFDAAARVMPPEYWVYDGVHPTAAGHALIARHWMETMRCGK